MATIIVALRRPATKQPLKNEESRARKNQLRPTSCIYNLREPCINLLGDTPERVTCIGLCVAVVILFLLTCPPPSQPPPLHRLSFILILLLFVWVSCCVGFILILCACGACVTNNLHCRTSTSRMPACTPYVHVCSLQGLCVDETFRTIYNHSTLLVVRPS
jgi:hypothetical protein